MSHDTVESRLMLHRHLGPSGTEASVDEFGALAIGGWPWGASDEAEAIGARKYGLRWDGEEAGEFFLERTVPEYDRPSRVFKNLQPESIRCEVEA